MKPGLYRVVNQYFVAGFVIENGAVTQCAPILRKNIARWMRVARWISE